MQVVHSIDALRAALKPRESPAFVPTMGNLHDGHLALLAMAKGYGDVRVASIFVNRLQFGPNEDFDAYPRTFERDCALLEAAGCDVLFAPREADLYPQAQTFLIHPPTGLADVLEGAFRPGFFVGVSTVVMKLFQCVFSGTKAQAHAFFGEKDFQQQLIIRHLVTQFALPVTIVTSPTIRESDGLAMSSRNGYLSEAERAEAPRLQACLQAMLAAVKAGQQSLESIEGNAMSTLRAHQWQPDYMVIRRREDLGVPTVRDRALVVLGAAKLGRTRLIDNLSFDR